MKHEIEIPDEYEISSTFSSTGTVDKPRIEIYLRKKQTKDFDYFVDKYLREDPFTTKDEISNHLFTEDIKEIKTKLRSGDYRWVPWEIKIGLFRFICEEMKMLWWREFIRWESGYISDALKDLLRQSFIDDLFNTKTN